MNQANDSFKSYNSMMITTFLLSMFLLLSTSESRLSATFYDTSCPDALSTIRTAIGAAISREPRMAASLIHLQFHDCFVGDCDASILLDDSPSIKGEKNALGNKNSTRGYDVIEDAKSRVEAICPGVVSCADIIALAARDATVLAGGPSWTVKLGRRDSTTASITQVARDLPKFMGNLEQLISSFAGRGLNKRDMVALLGSHTIGQARCSTFRSRLYNRSDIDAGFARTRKNHCPANGGDPNLAPLDLVTPNCFDNNYFKNLIEKKGLLGVDQVLFSGGSTDSIVTEYSRNSQSFFSDFASAMVKMSEINPRTGLAGQVRRICSVVN